jgi:FemAB-related protein (PEP-CTERM system-associated)
MPVDRYVTFKQEVQPKNLDELLAAIPRGVRNRVRKAYKTEFEVRHAVADWRPFERLHSLTLRRLGTPSFPPQHFANLVREFGPRVEVGELLYEGRVVAASMCFVFGNSTHIYYACTDQDLNHLSVNYRMYAELMVRAGECGSAVFDFGRSKLDTGNFEFKKQWATVPQPLPYEILLVRRKTLPNFTPKNSKFSLPIEIWKRLPLPLTRALGPRLIRLFP